MSIVKVIEVIAGSEKSFDDATQKALEEAAKANLNGTIRSIYIKEMNANVEDNKIVSYGVNAKVSILVDDEL
jgi:dodecin